ncbi:MAG: nuclear transport factor 2 family protein [Deltaproteobacteria bacterium]|nr:nuclear transport factor 2 family protein [Deltaproteobacteria bacterium]
MIPIEDILAIEQLLNRYCHVLDRGTVDELVELFHPTAVLFPIYEGENRYEGWKAILAWYTNYKNRVQARLKFLRHKVQSPFISIEDDSAISVSYLDADSIKINTNEPIITFGRYDDMLVKDYGIWYFKERRIYIYYSYILKGVSPERGR